MCLVYYSASSSPLLSHQSITVPEQGNEPMSTEYNGYRSSLKLTVYALSPVASYIRHMYSNPTRLGLAMPQIVGWFAVSLGLVASLHERFSECLRTGKFLVGLFSRII